MSSCVCGGFAIANSEQITDPNTGHVYQRIDTTLTWSDARSYCEAFNGYLATITSSAEDLFVYSNLGIAQNIWLGGTDENAEGQWSWITGEPWSYTNWSPNQPDDGGAGRDYLVYWQPYPGQWADAGLPDWDRVLPFICEWDELSSEIKPEISVVDGFIKLDIANEGEPLNADCSSNSHEGRMVLDSDAGILYLCTSSGWLAK